MTEYEDTAVVLRKSMVLMYLVLIFAPAVAYLEVSSPVLMKTWRI